MHVIFYILNQFEYFSTNVKIVISHALLKTLTADYVNQISKNQN